MHDALGFGLVLLAILAGIFFNSSRFDRMEARLDWMQADLSQFYRDLGDHGARIEMMEKRNSAK